MRLVEKTEDQRYFNNILNQQVKILVFHELTIFYKFRIFELEHNRKTFYPGLSTIRIPLLATIITIEY